MSLGEGIPQGVCNKPNLHTVVTVIVRRPIALERDGVWGTLVAEAELGARARAGRPRIGGGQDGTQKPPG